MPNQRPYSIQRQLTQQEVGLQCHFSSARRRDSHFLEQLRRKGDFVSLFPKADIVFPTEEEEPLHFV
jgi:hypothetical protein